MESLRSVIELVRHEEKLEEPEDLTRAREDAMELLFSIYDGVGAKFDTWMRATDAIPADKLVFAIAVIIRTHKWKELPKPGEIHTVARAVAGLDVEQYKDGHYLPPPNTWPPYGKKYAIMGGVYPLQLTAAQALVETGLTLPALRESTT